MNTPIVDFVRAYDRSGVTRLHMPGHKGRSFLGCEAWDITEIRGADALYEAEGIIARSEENAARIFGTGATFYSTEGSSQCIRAMVHLAVTNRGPRSSTMLVGRNAHKAFLYAAALTGCEVQWLWPENEGSLCACPITAETVAGALKGMDHPPAAVYVTSPDYLGNMLDIGEIADVCHQFGTRLLVDNAHGAYLHFLQPSRHPMDLGADLCCDSAHKTLPVLTGGAYLHVSKKNGDLAAKAKAALGLYGSTSPSYLLLQSLDLCNRYLDQGYPQRLRQTVERLDQLKEMLAVRGWAVLPSDPLKLTLRCQGEAVAQRLRRRGVECEFASPDHVVLMFTPENGEEDLCRFSAALGQSEMFAKSPGPAVPQCPRAMSIREAVFAPQTTIPVVWAEGRICGSPTCACPPAIAIVVPGEIITEEAVRVLSYYGMTTVEVVQA